MDISCYFKLMQTMHASKQVFFSTDFFFQKHLKEKISNLESALKSQEDEHTKANDDLYKKLQEVKGQLQASEEHCSKLQGNIDDQTQKLSAAGQKIQELETTVTSKVHFS